MTACSVIYYPGQDLNFGTISGHVDLEFKGIVYTFGPDYQSEVNITRKIKKAKSGGFPFERFSIRITPEQSDQLDEILKSSRGGPLLSDFGKLKNYCIRICNSEKKYQMLKNAVKNPLIPKSYNCMDVVSNILSEANIMRIPKIIKTSPLFSSFYLRSKRYLGDRRIKVANYGSCFSSVRNFLFVNACRLAEIGRLALPVLTLALLIV